MQPATLLKVTLLHVCFSRFFKLYKWYQIARRITDRMVNFLLFVNKVLQKYIVHQYQFIALLYTMINWSV